MSFAPTAQGKANFKLLGYAETVGGISDSTGWGVIENTQTETSGGTGTLTVNTADGLNYVYNGTLRNTASGSGTLALVKDGPGMLTLQGANCGQYTGGLTVKNGTLDYSGGTLPGGAYTIQGGTLYIGALSKSIGTFQITGGTVTGTGTLTSNATL